MKNVVLIGFMGTGKSSCGRAIAQQLGYRLVDLDKEIETKYKMPIPTMFKVHGEDWFRQKEKEMVAYWAKQKNVVISTGGGTVKNPENTACLRKNGKIICLQADIDTLMERTSRQGRRPVLDARAAQLGGNRRAAIASLLEERQEMYKGADLYVDTGRLSPLQVAARVSEFIRKS